MVRVIKVVLKVGDPRTKVNWCTTKRIWQLVRQKSKLVVHVGCAGELELVEVEIRGGNAGFFIGHTEELGGEVRRGAANIVVADLWGAGVLLSQLQQVMSLNTAAAEVVYRYARHAGSARVSAHLYGVVAHVVRRNEMVVADTGVVIAFKVVED